MEISDVTAVTVEVPLVPLEEHLGIGPYVTNHGRVETMERVLVRVDTDEGLTGWGEMRVFLSPAATEAVIEDGVGPLVTGQSPFEIERLRRQVFVEYTNVDLFFAAVETACWDIVGQTLDRPVYELLGGWTAPSQSSQRHRQALNEDDASAMEVPVAFCLGILSPEESRIKAQESLDAGFSVLKTKAGRDWRQDVERIKAMHEETNGQLEFRLDPNQGWTPDRAVRVGSMLEQAGIHLQYMEQPIRVDSHRTLARLRQRLRQPIAPNEDTYRPHNLQRLLEAGAMDAAVLDLTPAGGISGLRQQATVLEDAGIPFTHHCAFDLGIRTAAILHAGAGFRDSRYRRTPPTTDGSPIFWKLPSNSKTGVSRLRALPDSAFQWTRNWSTTIGFGDGRGSFKQEVFNGQSARVELSVRDRPAIVTGGSRGIGRAVAAQFAEAGGDAVICSPSYEGVESVARELTNAHDGRVVPVECDVTDRDAVRGLVDTAVDEFGAVRVLVNNAGASDESANLLHRCTEETFERMIDLNLKGQFLLRCGTSSGWCLAG